MQQSQDSTGYMIKKTNKQTKNSEESAPLIQKYTEMYCVHC